MNWTPLLAQADIAAEEPAADEQLAAAGEEIKSTAADAFSGDTDAMWALFQDYGMPLVWALAIIIISFIVGKMASGMVQRAAGKAKVDLTLSRFFGKLVYYAILVLGVTFALSKFGIEMTSFAAILAAMGFAVGMAMSGTLGNFANGVMLLIFRPFDVGDVISAAGVTAKVNAIELFTTTLDTPDNRRIIVPNSAIYGGIIENITHHPERRCDVNVGIDYSADMDKTREVLTKAAEALDEYNVKGEGRGFQVFMIDLGDSSVNWVVRFWTTGADFWTAKEKLTHAVKQHLDEAGIGIPFPQMDVHMNKVGE